MTVMHNIVSTAAGDDHICVLLFTMIMLPASCRSWSYRSLCLNVANVALYHVSYSPEFM